MKVVEKELKKKSVSMWQVPGIPSVRDDSSVRTRE